MNSDLVEFDIFLHATRPDGIEQSESTNSIHIGSVLAKVKGQLCGFIKINNNTCVRVLLTT